MIDSNNPEIDVDELMQKIRQEVASSQGRSPIAATRNHKIGTANLRTNISYIESLLFNAESRAYARTKWPDKLNRFPFNISSKLQKFILKIINFLFKDQREVNFNLLISLKESVKLNHQLIEQIQTLKMQMDERFSAIDTRLQETNERPNAVDNRLQDIDQRLSVIDNCCQELNESLYNLDNSIQGLNNHFSTIDIHFLEMDKRLASVDTRFQGMNERLDAVDSCFQKMNERLDAVDSRFQKMDERLGSVDIHFLRMDERLGAVNSRFQGMEERLLSVDKSIHRMDERSIKNDSYLKNELTQQKRLITMFLEEVRKSLPEPLSQENLQSFVNEEAHLLDTFYVAFEDQFRGSREDIFNRLQIYLPLIEKEKFCTSDAPILDVGCGRGEWLELLRDSGYTAKGIDINRVMVAQCKDRGLEVMEADVISFLRTLPDSSLSVITGFHIIEHLPFEVLINLVDEILRVLHIGGLTILESPNPENIIVGACNFYSDPTHIKPLFPPTIKFVLEQRGFSDVQLMHLSSYRIEDTLQFIESDNPIAPKVNPLIEIAKSNFYASPDFAVIAKKY